MNQVILFNMEHIDTGMVQMGKDYRMVVSCGEKIIPITKKQFKFLKLFLANGDVEEAAQAAGVERTTVVRWFRDPRFRLFLKERLEWAGARNGCTFDWAISELKKTWDGKQEKSKIQFECIKELNRMLGHVKEIQGGVNAREFINAEYVVIQKNPTFESGFKAPQISGNSRGITGEVYIPDVRQTVGQDSADGMEAFKINGEAQLDGLVCDKPAETSQGHPLAQTPSNSSPIQGSI